LNEKRLQLFKMQADICKTMSDPKRLMIVHELREGEMSVGQLATRLELPQANVSQHLSILRKRGIVATRREGTTVHYSLSGNKIAEACDMVRSVLAEQLEKSKALAGLLKSV
jgi:DNA-binding transcriptional ArsR family regulator